MFTSNKKITGGGAQCTAECVGENDEKTTTLQSAGKKCECEILSFALISFLKDFICPENRSNTTVTVEHGDYLAYNTNPGGAAEWVTFNPIHDKLSILH